MQSTEPIINKAANRGVVEIDLATFLPGEDALAFIDLKDFLFKGLIVREAEFRKQVTEKDWTAYKDKLVCIHCSTDAIIPMWAYMLISVSLADIASEVIVAQPDDALSVFHRQRIAQIDFTQYEGKRVIVKGCGERTISPDAFALISHQLAKVARAVMYGEACSSVPVFKKSID